MISGRMKRMRIEKTENGDLLELKLSGALDNDSSIHFQNAIDDEIQEGWHRFLIHMEGVDYVSSAGISAMLAVQKSLLQLDGFFGICDPTQEVQVILSQVRLLDRFLCDPQEARKAKAFGTQTRLMNLRFAQEEDLDLEIYTIEEGDNRAKCHLFGTPDPLFDSEFTEQHCQSVTFEKGTFGIGLGALGGSFETSRSRFGEFLSMNGNVAQSGQGLPDYSMAQEDFSPTVQVLYGAKCVGEFSHFLRFEILGLKFGASLSSVVSQCLAQSGCDTAGVVMLAESAGLIGARPRKSPAEMAVQGAARFEIPAIRDWITFSPERVYARNLALVTGIVSKKNSSLDTLQLRHLMRPFDEAGEIEGHLHSAIFPYRPFKKRTLDYDQTIEELFDSRSIQDVLHLLSDYRTDTGIGESEFRRGACWITPIDEIVKEE